MEALATRYRPHEFEDCCGQESIIRILRQQLQETKFAHSYLFCGASGCGKTTLARILANKINKGFGSPIEIDAASNNGIDNIRELIKSAQQRAIDCQYKIFILDECHALTSQSWQALLKCIEEPPEYTIFIFCTTDPQKIPATILNRCMRFQFNRIHTDKIRSRLNFICEKEGFTDYEESTAYISKICKGQMRDAISFLDKAASYSKQLTISNTLYALGNYSYKQFFELLNMLLDGNEGKVLEVINNLYNEGADLSLFIDQFITFCLDINKYNLMKSTTIISIPESMVKDIENVVAIDNPGQYYFYVVNKLLELKNMLKTDMSPKSTIEIFLLQIARCV